MPVLVPSYLAGSVSGRIVSHELARVIAVWDELPDAFKAGILALVQAAPSDAERASRE